MKGKAVIEDFNFRRVLVGKVAVTEIAELFNRHNDLLLEKNIRRYLGLHSNRVNAAIHETLVNEHKRDNFYFFNKREEGGRGSSVVTSSIVAESVLAIWRKKPQQAKFRRKEHFGKLYDAIFKELNAAQA